MKSMIVAYDLGRTIGRDGGLPWLGKMPDDLRHFTELTTGKPVIMGRRTYDSLPEKFRPLPNRQNIVASLSATAIEGVEIARSLEEAYKLAEGDPMIIGGAQLYEQALPDVDVVYATEIETYTPDGDAFFPKLPGSEWGIAEQQSFRSDDRNKFAYSFITYVRRNPIDIFGSEE